MVPQLGNELPSTLTPARIEAVLALANSYERILKEALDADSSPVQGARLVESLDHPKDRDAAAATIRGLIERIVLTPSEKWAETDVVLHGDLGTILEWAGNGRENTRTEIPMPEMSVSVVAVAGFEPATFRS